MFKKTVSTIVLLGFCCTSLAAIAQRNGYNDAYHQRYVRHDDWRKGYRMRPDDWRRAQRVNNWRAYRLSAPPRGYEWREVDGNYVLAAVATGIVASVIAASAAH